MAEPWKELAAGFDRRPQPPGDDEEAAWLPKPPAWLGSGDALHAARKAWPRLYREGGVVWGRIFIANNVLWAPGDVDAPAVVLYSFDPSIRADPARLDGICHALSLLRDEERPVPPGLAQMRTLVTDDYARPVQEPISDRLTWGRAVFLAAVMIHRQHLPAPMLTGLSLPLLVCPGERQPCLVVPLRYWPASLCKAWVEAAREAPAPA